MEQNQSIRPSNQTAGASPISETTAVKETPLQNPAVPSSLEPKKINKLLIISLILLFISILGVGGTLAYKNYFAKQVSPTPSPIAPSPSPTPFRDPATNWYIYKNEKYGFELKYPENWTQSGPVSENDQTIVYLHTQEVYGPEPKSISYFVFIIEVDELPKLKIETTTINNNTVLKTDQLPSRFGSLTYYIKREDGKYLGLTLTPYDFKVPYIEQQKYVGLFDQIISSLELIN